MNTSRTLYLILLFVIVSVVSCSDNPTVVDVPKKAPLVPAPSIEYTRPLVNTDLTFRAFVGVDVNDADAKVMAAESTLAALVSAGVPLADAWVTEWADGFRDPPFAAYVTIRLWKPYPAIADVGFDAPVERYHLSNETRHYVFRLHANTPLPSRVIEFNGPSQQNGVNLYRLEWSPEGLLYPGVYVMPDDWLAGVEFYIRTLIEEGVEVRNAWMSAHRVDCQWGWEALVVEAQGPHPLLAQSGFLERGMDGTNCVRYVWNYCFENCPGEVELPKPEQTWMSPEEWLKATPRTPPWVYYRAIPSDEYDATLGTREKAEAHLQEMLRSRAGIRRAWIPVSAASGDYTYVAVEMRDHDWRLWWWGYDEEPAGGFAALDWSFVRLYDFDAGALPEPSTPSARTALRPTRR